MKYLLLTLLFTALTVEVDSQSKYDLFSEYHSIKLAEQGVYFVFANKNIYTGRIISCTPYMPETPGIWIFIDTAQIVKNIHLSEKYFHKEYIDMIENEEFLESWIGKPVFQASFILPDVVSGATETCDTITLALQNTLKEIEKDTLLNFTEYKRKKNFLILFLCVLSLLSILFYSIKFLC